MSRLLGIAMLFSFTSALWAWQQPAVRPNFTGSWHLDPAKSKTELKDDLVWKIDHKGPDIAIEEIAAGKSMMNAKCSIGKACEIEDSGKKTSAMTYFLDMKLVQMRSAADNSTTVKRHLSMNEDGTLQVELITIVPADKTEVLVFTKEKSVAGSAKVAPPKP